MPANSLYLRFERESNTLPQGDAFEKIAAFCLHPLRLARGHQVVMIKKEGAYTITEKRAAKIARIIGAISSALLFPMTLIGILTQKLSSTHRLQVKKLQDYLKPDPQTRVFQLLKERNLFIKIIGNDLCRDGHTRKELFGDFQWDYLLNELQDPQGTRLQRRAKKTSERVKYVYDGKQRAMVLHKRENYYQGTNKTSLTLLPANAKTSLAPTGAYVGLLFDATRCQTKGKYVFKTDGVTHAKWWRTVFDRAELSKPDFAKVLEQRLKQTVAFNILFQPLGSLDKLRHQLAEQEKGGFIAHYNEVLASVNKEAIVGLFCQIGSPYPGQNPEDFEIECLSRKIEAMSRQAYLKEQLGLTQEIYLIDASGLSLYPVAQQKKDLEQVLNTPLLHKYADFLSGMRRQDNKQAVITQELRSRIQELLAGR